MAWLPPTHHVQIPRSMKPELLENSFQGEDSWKYSHDCLITGNGVCFFDIIFSVCVADWKKKKINSNFLPCPHKCTSTLPLLWRRSVTAFSQALLTFNSTTISRSNSASLTVHIHDSPGDALLFLSTFFELYLLSKVLRLKCKALIRSLKKVFKSLSCFPAALEATASNFNSRQVISVAESMFNIHKNVPCWAKHAFDKHTWALCVGNPPSSRQADRI